MKELKEYLAPELVIVEIGDYVFTDNSKEDNNIQDPYESQESNWWD